MLAEPGPPLLVKGEDAAIAWTLILGFYNQVLADSKEAVGGHAV